MSEPKENGLPKEAIVMPCRTKSDHIGRIPLSISEAWLAAGILRRKLRATARTSATMASLELKNKLLVLPFLANKPRAKSVTATMKKLGSAAMSKKQSTGTIDKVIAVNPTIKERGSLAFISVRWAALKKRFPISTAKRGTATVNKTSFIVNLPPPIDSMTKRKRLIAKTKDMATLFRSNISA